MNAIKSDFEFLIKPVEDIKNKPHLIPALKAHLVTMGHSPEDTQAFLDNFFKDD